MDKKDEDKGEYSCRLKAMLNVVNLVNLLSKAKLAKKRLTNGTLLQANENYRNVFHLKQSQRNLVHPSQSNQLGLSTNKKGPIATLPTPS